MPRNNKEKVVESENEILAHLKKDASISAYALSKKLGVSRQKVWRIKKELEEKQVIWGYTTIIDQNKRGYKQFVILIKRSNKVINDSLMDQFVIKMVKDYSEDTTIDIESFICLYGQYDWMMILNTTDVLTAKAFVSKLKIEWEEFFEDIVLLESMNVLKKNWIVRPNLDENKKLICKIL